MPPPPLPLVRRGRNGGRAAGVQRPGRGVTLRRRARRQASHLCAPRVAAELRRARVAAELLELGGGADRVRFALRTLVVPYPERAVAVWVMLAVVYTKVAP